MKTEHVRKPTTYSVSRERHRFRCTGCGGPTTITIREAPKFVCDTCGRESFAGADMVDLVHVWIEGSAENIRIREQTEREQLNPNNRSALVKRFRNQLGDTNES